MALRSSGCGDRARHRLNNFTEDSIEYFWLDYDGNEKRYGSVLPGCSGLIDTYELHPWRIRVSGGNSVLGEYVGPSATLTVVPGAPLRVAPGVQPRTLPDTLIEPFGIYRRRAMTRRGIGVHACDCVGEDVVRIATFTLEAMLAGVPEPVMATLRRWGAVLSVVGRRQSATTFPEFRYARPERPAGEEELRRLMRGVGGTIANPTCTVAEENVAMVDDPGYEGESILVHEMAHSVDGIGLDGSPLQQEIKDCWEAAKARATYDPGCYMISNAGEYWAEGAQAWFEATIRTDTTSGFNTRDRIKQVDPWLASLLTRVFGDGPWRFWHTSPRPLAGDEERWNRARAQGLDRAAQQLYGAGEGRDWPPTTTMEPPQEALFSTVPPDHAAAAPFQLPGQGLVGHVTPSPSNGTQAMPHNVVYRPSRRRVFDPITAVMRPLEKLLDRLAP